jgi:two-component system response regulator AtoC
MTTVFVIDDEREMVDLIALGLKKRGFAVVPFGAAADALAAIPGRDVDVIVTDLNMKGMTGLELCQRVAADRPDIPVLMLTAFGSFETAVGAIRAGAYDFVTKPVEIEALAIAIRRAAEHRALRGEVRRLREVVASTRGRGELIGASAAMQQVFQLVDQVSAADATVLITGERGTGKEAVAREIHNRSRRAAGPFVAVDCAAIPEPHLEGELFGHARGAAGHTGPSRGLFEQAEGGTLFVDEIGELPPALQPRLLRALQEHKVRPAGADAEVAVDVRLVAATGRDLEEMVEDKRFREDLYYRINVIHIPLPPLRARGGDVLLLAAHLLRRHAAVLDKKVVGLSTAAAERMMTYDWPGNVRELESCLERAVALARFEEIQVDDLPDKIRASARRHGSLSGTEIPELLTLEEIERRHVLRVLEACDGNRTDAAKMLGLDRKTLYRKLLRWGVGD